MNITDNRIQTAQRVAIALVAAFGGGFIALYLGLPAAELTGSILAVTLCALFGAKPQVPNLLRNLSFAVIGITLGAGVTPTILSDLGRFSLSLVFLTVTMVIVTFVASQMLFRIFETDRPTALLATSPGALSYVLALASDGRANMQTVTVLQGMRLLAISLLLPALVTLFGGEVPTGSFNQASAGLVESLLLLAASSCVALVFDRFRFPAAWLLAGVVVSGMAHGADVASGRPWVPLLFAGFVVAGAVIGSRFGKFTKTELRKLALAGLAVSSSAIVISALASILAARILGLPFGQIWVSYAPGGVEGMAAIAVSLGYDPVFVATHHIFRLAVLIAVLPFVVPGKG